jgi:hypothetical protein
MLQHFGRSEPVRIGSRNHRRFVRFEQQFIVCIEEAAGPRQDSSPRCPPTPWRDTGLAIEPVPPRRRGPRKDRAVVRASDHDAPGRRSVKSARNDTNRKIFFDWGQDDFCASKPSSCPAAKHLQLLVLIPAPRSLIARAAEVIEQARIRPPCWTASALRAGVLWCYKGQLRKISAITARIARQQRLSFDRCMGADEEVGKNAGSPTARSAVLLKHLSGQE